MESQRNLRADGGSGQCRLLWGALYTAVLLPVPALGVTEWLNGSWQARGVDLGGLFSFDGPAERVEKARADQQALAAADAAPAEADEPPEALDDWTETGAPPAPSKPKRPKTCPPGHHRHQGPGNSFSCGRASPR